METTSTQKLLLALVYFGINILRLIEKIGTYVRPVGIFFVRATILASLLLTLVSSFPLKVNQSYLSNIPVLLSPQSDVLGAARMKGPVLVSEVPLPYISSFSVYAVDPVYDKEFVDINSEIQLAPASTTKLMTALVALDIYETTEWLTIPHFCTEIEGQKSGFYAGDSFLVADLLKSLLINSSADAACALSVGKITYYEFVNLMNAKAKKYGMDDTNFSNPVGLDGTNGEHLSTAKDLYILSLEARKIDLIKEIVSITQTDITSSSDLTITLWNTNDLLSLVPGTVGIKTGRTEAAGEVLVYEYDNADKNIIIVVMGSSDRFGDTRNILNWILQNYKWLK